MELIKYSIIILTDNINHFDNTLKSIFKQKYDLNKIEIFILDLTCDDSIYETINHYNSLKNIHCIKSVGEKYIDNLNVALERCSGKYISFINSSSYYENNNTLRKVEKLMSKNDIISINSKYFDLDNKKCGIYKMQPNKTGSINLLNEPFLINFNLNAYFFKRNIIEKISFDNNFFSEPFNKFLLNILEEKYIYYFEKKYSIITYEPFETNTSKNSIQYKKEWYIDSLDNYIKYAKDTKKIERYIQYFLLYMIYSKMNCNIYDRNKNVLSENEVSKFMDKVIELCGFIDDDLILSYIDDLTPNFKIPRWLRYYIIKRKYNKVKNYYFDGQNIVLNYGTDKKIKNLDVTNEVVKVYAINYSNGKLKFDCTSSIIDILNEDEFEIYAKYNDKLITINRSQFYPLLKAFGKTICRNYCFNFEVDIKDLKGIIQVFVKIKNKEFALDFSYIKVQSHLSNSKRSFWHYKNFILYNKVNHIEVKKANKLRIFADEMLFDFSKLKNEKNKKVVLYYIFLRILYYISSPFYKNKHIWLTWDKLYKAGDNGEYMYQYCLNNKKNIYYFIKKDSLDYNRLKKQNRKRCVEYNSIKAKLLSLHSEVILDTHANVISYCGFNGADKKWVCGLFNPEIICIQHGLTVQKIAQYQNRLFDNIKFYCCASKYEIENISDPFYDYSENQMALTGLARYDGLKSKEEKIILITPTWRRNVVNSSVAHIKKNHNDNFKNSDYFKIYNSLINNKELIKCAKDTGYRIIYLLHPAMSGQLEDFEKNDFVDIIPATGNINYEDILTRSALMLTDYSGVQFDFAYQRKVLVYYHPEKLPPHYDAGGLKYDTMGFGPICKNEEQVVSELCYNMKNGCIINDKYKKRADDFFAYDDFNNCERILKRIEEYLDEIK